MNYIVSYDLQQPGQRYAAIEAYLRGMTAYAKVLETVWIISSQQTAEAIRDHIAALADDNDKILVALVGGVRGRNIESRAFALVTQIGAA